MDKLDVFKKRLLSDSNIILEDIPDMQCFHVYILAIGQEVILREPSEEDRERYCEKRKQGEKIWRVQREVSYSKIQNIVGYFLPNFTNCIMEYLHEEFNNYIELNAKK